jgi:hypothetical protein
MPRQTNIIIRNGTTVPSGVDFNVGEPAWDKTAKKLYIKADDNTMAEIGAGGGGGTTFTYSSSAPGSPSAGDEWLDSTSGILYTYVNDGNSSAWVELGPFGAESISPTIAGMIF